MLSKAQFCAGLNVVAQYGVPRIDASTEYDVGSEAFLSYFEDEVLHSMVFLGGAAVRFIEGPFGSGKTHLLELIEASALKNNMAIAVTQLDHDLKLDNWSQITKHVLNSLEVRINGEKARSLPDILDLLERFGTADYKRLKEHPLPHAGIKRAMLIYHETQNNTHARFKLAEFLRGERTGAGELSRVGVKGVKGPLSHRNAEQVLKTVLGGLFYLGLNGTALLFDETEQGFRSNRASQKIRVSANLMRRLIDGSASGTLVGTVVLFAILPGFIEACGRAYPALGQRLETVGSESEPGAWRQPVLTIDNISSVRNQDEFMHAICSKFVELVKYYGGKTDGLYDLMISRSTEILEKDASSGYRRSMVKL